MMRGKSRQKKSAEGKVAWTGEEGLYQCLRKNRHKGAHGWLETSRNWWKNEDERGG